MLFYYTISVAVNLGGFLAITKLRDFGELDDITLNHKEFRLLTGVTRHDAESIARFIESAVNSIKNKQDKGKLVEFLEHSSFQLTFVKAKGKKAGSSGVIFESTQTQQSRSQNGSRVFIFSLPGEDSIRKVRYIGLTLSGNGAIPPDIDVLLLDKLTNHANDKKVDGKELLMPQTGAAETLDASHVAALSIVDLGDIDPVPTAPEIIDENDDATSNDSIVLAVTDIALPELLGENTALVEKVPPPERDVLPERIFRNILRNIILGATEDDVVNYGNGYYFVSEAFVKRAIEPGALSGLENGHVTELAIREAIQVNMKNKKGTFIPVIRLNTTSYNERLRRDISQDLIDVVNAVIHPDMSVFVSENDTLSLYDREALAQYVEIIDDETLDARSFYKKVNAGFARDGMDRPIIKGYYIRLSPDLIRSINNEDVFVTATREQSLGANTFDIATIKKLGKDITDFETQLESLDFQIQETEEQILKNQQEIQKLEEEGQIHVIEQSVRQTLGVVQIESSTLINIETITSEALRSLVASVNESLQKLLESADQIDLETQKRNQKKGELHEFLYRLQENYADLRQRKRELSAKLIPLVAQKNEIIRALGLG